MTDLGRRHARHSQTFACCAWCLFNLSGIPRNGQVRAEMRKAVTSSLASVTYSVHARGLLRCRNGLTVLPYDTFLQMEINRDC